MPVKTLVVGGTGPTGPPIVAGLEARGHDVTICHTGGHEVDKVMHLPHIHCDVRDEAALSEAIGGQDWDVAIVTYGRLRTIAEVLAGRVGHFISVGGGPAIRGYFDPWAHSPPGLPLPTPETAPTASEEDDGKSYRIARTEEYVFEHHPTATHFRYPYVYGPRQLAPREWCVVKRILDGRPHIVLADGGQSAHSFGYVDNLAHAVHLAVEQPEAAGGRIFHCGDEELLTVRQVVEICAAELDHEWEIVSMPPELAVPARPLMMQPSTHHRAFDISDLRHVLGYRDVVSAREAVARTARWLAENPHPPGDIVERIMEDPFDYENEDRLIAWWKQATATPPELEWPTMPGYGLSFAGPGTSYQRPDTRI
ncbi:MAG: NAD-dependent epimerase/dehydratase family protein [Acidimicrobiales bacterium]|jgi:nucleoside-diphosphate-sugar epimerase|nr:NAD-dependent epimerase/dehydratase family protein [Acidimicrobiales bacterium]